jgi:ribonuclease-3
MSKPLGMLENLLGYKFRDIKLLERSVTHRSWAYENLSGEGDAALRGAENESFEFVGDSVLGLVIAEELFRRHPENTEGELTLMKHHLVSTGTLATAADRLTIGEFLRVGKGEEKTGGRKKQALLADALEAIIAAIFFDSGYISARSVVKSIFANDIREATPSRSLDYKTMLQELLQAKKLAAPVYRVTKTEGKPHDRTFSVEATWEDGTATGTGNSIKAAEMMAASKALETLRKR